MSRGARFPGSGRKVTVTVGGAHPLVRALIGSLDGMWSNGLAGRTGKVRAGDGADPAYSFRGYVAYQRTSAIPPGAVAGVLRSPFTALPATSPADIQYATDPGARVLAHLATLTPLGAR